MLIELNECFRMTYHSYPSTHSCTRYARESPSCTVRPAQDERLQRRRSRPPLTRKIECCRAIARAPRLRRSSKIRGWTNKYQTAAPNTHRWCRTLWAWEIPPTATELLASWHLISNKKIWGSNPSMLVALYYNDCRFFATCFEQTSTQLPQATIILTIYH